jgi:integrase/recombinase XerD
LGTVVLEEKWPVLGRHEQAAVWLHVWADLGRAPRTIDAYARGPSRRGANVVSIDSGAGFADATLQQRMVPVRLFYDFLVEEGVRESNPVGRGRYSARNRGGGGYQRGLIPRLTKLPWIPTESQWLELLAVAAGESQ